MLDELRLMSRMTRRMSCDRRWLFPAESTHRHVYASQNGEPARHLFYKRSVVGAIDAISWVQQRYHQVAISECFERFRFQHFHGTVN